MIPPERPGVALTVRESRFELGTTAGYVAGDALWLSAETTGVVGPIGPTGQQAISATITSLIDRCQVDGVGKRGIRGMYAQGVGFAGSLNLTVQDSSILDLQDAGITVEKTDEGNGILNVVRSTIGRCGWAGRPAADPRLDSGIVMRGIPRRAGTGYANPVTQLVLNMNQSEVLENRLHGVYFHHPWLSNDFANPLLFGTNSSIVMTRSTLRNNGFASSEPPARDGSGMLVHLEQGNLVGQNSSFPTVPLSQIVNNDIFGNALHGLELRGRPETAGTMYNIELRGIVAQNDIDRNGFPTVPGPATASAELLVLADVTNMNGLAGTGVGTNLFITQNTMFEDVLAGALASFAALPLNDWRVSHQATQFLGNLGVHTDNTTGTPAFAGFAAGSRPGVIQSNFGAFENNTGLPGGNFNALGTDVVTFSAALVNGHFVNPAQRNLAINQDALQIDNLAIDRTLGIPGQGTQIPGQQSLDKNALDRFFDNPSIPEVGPNTFSDSGSHENQGT